MRVRSSLGPPPSPQLRQSHTGRCHGLDQDRVVVGRLPECAKSMLFRPFYIIDARVGVASCVRKKPAQGGLFMSVAPDTGSEQGDLQCWSALYQAADYRGVGLDPPAINHVKLQLGRHFRSAICRPRSSISCLARMRRSGRGNKRDHSSGLATPQKLPHLQNNGIDGNTREERLLGTGR